LRTSREKLNEIGTENTRLINILLLSALGLTTLLFVFNVNDGTFLKPIALYFFCLLIGAMYFCRVLANRKFEISYTLIHLAFMLYIVVSAISIFKAENIHLGLESILQLCCWFIIFSASAAVLKKNSFPFFIILLSGLTCGISLAQYIVPESSSLFNILHQISTISTFGNQTYFAGFLIIALPITVSQIIITNNVPVRKYAFVVVAIIIVYFLVKTESRSAWAAVLISMLLFAILNFRTTKARWGSIGIICITVILVATLFPDVILRRMNGIFEFNAHSSIARRLFFYEGAWKAFLSSPIIGQGIGNFIVFLPKFRSPEYWAFQSEDIVAHAHNEYLEILSETGIVGFFSYTIIMVLLFQAIFLALKQHSGYERTILVGFFSAAVAVLIDNFSSMNLRTMPVAVTMWMLLGVSLQYTTVKFITIIIPFSEAIPKSARWLPVIICTIIVMIMTPKIYSVSISEKSYLDGVLLRLQGNTQGAEIKFRDVIERRPRHAEARLYYAAQLIEENRFAEGAENIRAILSVYPYYPKARTLGAICSLELGDTVKAFRQIEEELTLERSPQTLYYASYLSRRAQRKQDEVKFMLDLLHQNVKDSVKDFAIQGINRLGEICESSVTSEKYPAILEQLHQTFSSDAEILLALGTCYSNMGMLTDAEQLLIQATTLRPDNKKMRQTLELIRAKITQQYPLSPPQ
jgi:O-antigen ligase/thioredoxin-like negative regulator of GroEL